MISKLCKLLCCSALGTGFTGAGNAAAIYQFSYLFAGTSAEVRGTLVGVDDGVKVTGVSDLTLEWAKGGAFTSFAGPLSIVEYTDSGVGGTAKEMYFLRDSNNFLIVDCPYAPGSPCSSSELFLLRNGTSPGSEDALLSDIVGGLATEIALDRSSASSTWNLTKLRDIDPVQQVPEPGTSVLVACALLGLATIRRRQGRSSGASM